MAGRYTTYLDRDPEDVRGQMFENLNQGISGVGNIMIQKKLKERELQDAIELFRKKKEIEKEFAPYDVDEMTKKLRFQNLLGQLEQKRRLGVMAGQEAPSPEEMASFPPVLGGAEGGKVMLPKGAGFAEGQITSPEGERIGEYLPGYEPQPLGQEDVAGAMREKFAGGISKEELQRKALGMPRFTGRATQNQLVTLATKLAQAENPMAGEKEIQAKIPIAQKMLEGNIFSGQALSFSEGEYTDEQEKLIQDNIDAYPDKTREEIIEAMKEQGYL